MADENYWTYKPSSPTPSFLEAKECGAIGDNTLPGDWYKLSPGMRREIVRQYLKLDNL